MLVGDSCYGHYHLTCHLQLPSLPLHCSFACSATSYTPHPFLSSSCPFTPLFMHTHFICSNTFQVSTIWCSDILSTKLTSARWDSTGEILQAEEFILANWMVSDHLVKLALLCYYGMTTVNILWWQKRLTGIWNMVILGTERTELLSQLHKNNTNKKCFSNCLNVKYQQYINNTIVKTLSQEGTTGIMMCM